MVKGHTTQIGPPPDMISFPRRGGWVERPDRKRRGEIRDGGRKKDDSGKFRERGEGVWL